MEEEFGGFANLHLQEFQGRVKEQILNVLLECRYDVLTQENSRTCWIQEGECGFSRLPSWIQHGPTVHEAKMPQVPYIVQSSGCQTFCASESREAFKNTDCGAPPQSPWFRGFELRMCISDTSSRDGDASNPGTTLWTAGGSEAVRHFEMVGFGVCPYKFPIAWYPHCLLQGKLGNHTFIKGLKHISTGLTALIYLRLLRSD